MAIVSHGGGDQLPQTRAKAAANFTSLVATHAELSTGDFETVGSGMGLEKFRGVCESNFGVVTQALGTQSQGTLTVDTQPTQEDTMTIGATVYTFVDIGQDEVQAEATLTMDTKPTEGDTLTIGSITYTFTASPLSYGNVGIGSTLLDSQNNLIQSIEGGNPVNIVHPDVTCEDSFSSDDLVITAITAGLAGNLLPSTETFTAGTNVFDAVTLGTTTYGYDTDGDYLIDTATSLTTCQAAIVAAINGTDGNNEPNLSVTCGAFSTPDAILTAILAGTAGDSIATTETFTAGTNVFDATTLGTTTAGSAGPSFTAIDDGDMLWDVRVKLNANFATAAAA